MFESKKVKADSKALEEKLNKNWDLWDTGDRSKFDNVEFVERLEEWYNLHNSSSYASTYFDRTNAVISGKDVKVNKYTHYKREILKDFGAMKLAKLRAATQYGGDVWNDDLTGLSRIELVAQRKWSGIAKMLLDIDIDNELWLWLSWHSSNETGFLITNKRFGYSLAGDTLKPSDIAGPIGSIEWAKIHSVIIKKSTLSIWPHTLLINGEISGRFLNEGGAKEIKYIQNLLSATAGLTAEFFKEPISATIASGTNDNLQDPVEQLRKLKSLLDEGVISEEEFTSKKKTLLNKI